MNCFLSGCTCSCHCQEQAQGRTEEERRRGDLIQGISPTLLTLQPEGSFAVGRPPHCDPTEQVPDLQGPAV